MPADLPAGLPAGLQIARFLHVDGDDHDVRMQLVDRAERVFAVHRRPGPTQGWIALDDIVKTYAATG